MSSQCQNDYRQPVEFTKLVKAEFDENEARFLLLVSDLTTAEANVERLEQQLACAKKDLGKAAQAQVLAEGNAASLRQQNQTLQQDYLKAKAAAEDLDKQVGSLKRTQLAFIDREDFVNLKIVDQPLSTYGREHFNTDYWLPGTLFKDQESNWFYFYDHYQNIQRNTLKQRALIQILAAYIDRAVFDTDFKDVILAQHPLKPGEPICESIFYKSEYLGVISLQGIEVLYYPPESKGKVVKFGPEPEYYYLKEGEIVQEGDEAEVSAKWNDPAKWDPVNEHSIGRAAPDPAYMSHTKYRRKIR